MEKFKMPNPKIRSLSYRLLSRLFSYPENDEWLLVGKKEQLSCLRRLSCSDAIRSWLDELSDTLRQADLETLQVEYVRLFDYRPVSPPYESAYLQAGQKNQMVKNLKALYRKAGLQCQEEEGHDHIIVELEFMYYLYAQEGKNGAEPLWQNIRSAFLDDHLLKWLPHFCGILQKKAAEPYRQLGFIANAVVESEKKRVTAGSSSPA